MVVLDENKCQNRKEVSEEELALVNIQGDRFHPEWKYIISSHRAF